MSTVRPTRRIFFLFILFVKTWGPGLGFEALIEPKNESETPSPDTGILPANYWSYGVERSTLIGATAESFEVASLYPSFSYNYFQKSPLASAVSIRMLNLKSKKNEANYRLLQVGNDASYHVRLYHPVYAAVGYRLLYMVPFLIDEGEAETSSLSIETEFGAGAWFSIYFCSSSRFYLFARVDLWRGVNTSKIKASSASIGMNFSINKMIL